jgi:NTP pyrophosphatase (non-canonical NTP hydrolase)
MRQAIIDFAKLMDGQLKANDHKGGWKNCDDEYLLERLLQEVGELVVAVMQAKELGLASSIVHKEAADVANFAMMISDNQRSTSKRPAADENSE